MVSYRVLCTVFRVKNRAQFGGKECDGESRIYELCNAQVSFTCVNFPFNCIRIFVMVNPHLCISGDSLANDTVNAEVHFISLINM